MYLSKLSNEKKHLFLDLELYISNADSEFSNQEKNIIDVHCLEMHIDCNKYQCELPLDEVYKKLERCTPEEQHIIFIEMLATVIADEVYHDEEKKIVETIGTILNISRKEIEQAFSIIYNLKKIYEELANFISI